MRGRNKKTIEEMEKEVAELIAEFGQCKQDIFTDSNKYRVLKKRSDTPGIVLNDHDIRQIMDLHPTFLLCKSIINKRNKIQAACKAANASAVTAVTATTAASPNVVNTSISSTAAAADSSKSS
jgi:hypothetical protein